MARRPFQSRSRTSRPNRSWAGNVATTFTALPAGNAIIAASFVLSSQGIDETVLRMVGTLAIRTDQLAATEEQVGAMGAIIVQETAFAAGAASVPDPVTEVGNDGWFLYVPIANSFTFATASGFQTQVAQYDFDSKAKRILSGGSRIILVIANSSPSHGFEFSLVIRLLSQVRGTR